MTEPQPTGNLTEVLTRARRIAFGAAASLVEVLQNPQKREANLQRLSKDLKDLAEDLAVKGQETELEARRYVDEMIHRPTGKPETEDAAPPTVEAETDALPASPQPPLSEAAAEISELTEQVHTLRQELERLSDRGE